MAIPKYSCGSDDISFCADACKNQKCFRHKSNMINPDGVHSFMYCKETEYCPLKTKKDSGGKNHA